jgi:hypothetical protein
MTTSDSHHDTSAMPSDNGATAARWYAVAKRYAERVPAPDRLDTVQAIVLKLLTQERKDCAQLPDARARAIAKNAVADYYRAASKSRPCIPLETPVSASGDTILELSDTIADAAAIDLDSMIDAVATLADVPDRIRQLGDRLVRGESLGVADRNALARYRAKHRLTL